jgi:hypothetical protein
MSEVAVAASNVTGAPTAGAEVAPQPPVSWAGQLWSPSMAQARRAELTSDAEYMKSWRAGDAVKGKELSDLRLISLGHNPNPPPPTSVEDVKMRMSAADAARQEQIKDWWRANVAPQNDVESFEFERGEATKSQKQQALRDIERAKRDPAFGRKVIAGDMDARLKWSRWHFIAHAARQVEG